MILATIRVSGVWAIPSELREIPAGIIGAQVKIEYMDSMWDNLTKTVVFSTRRVTKDALDAGELVTIPTEVVASPATELLVGVYGTDAAGNIAIPTLWANLGRIRSAADPSGDPSTDPSLPVWAQLNDRVGRLEQGGSSGGNVDLTGYATEEWVQEGYQPKGDYPLRSEIPPVPVQSVNGKTGAVSLSAADVGALPDTYTPPNQTAQQVGADPKGTASTVVSQHNAANNAHGDIRLELKSINDKLTAFFNSDDQTLDQLSEIVAYITSNKSLIDSITTSKVSVADIVNNLATNVSNRALSAAQGVVLKGLIDTLNNNLSKYALTSSVPTKVSQLTNDAGYLVEVPTGYATEQWVEGKIRAIVGDTETAHTPIVTPEMYGAVGDGVTDDSSAFITALKTGGEVVCDSTKTYYFAKPVDVRTLYQGHLNGNGAWFVNFHLYVNINDDFTDWNSAYSSGRFIVENMNFGQSWDELPEGWETPLITTGAPMIIRNINTRYPFVLATVDRYIDYMLCDSWTSMINTTVYEGLEWRLDAISCLNKSGEYVKFNGDTTRSSEGDAWVISQCTEFSNSKRPDYKMMHISRRRPLVVKSCVQCSFVIGTFSKAIFEGCHWEAKSDVTFATNYQNNVTFLNCFFYDVHVLNNHRTTVYQNCFFSVGYDTTNKTATLADTTGNIGFYDLKCELINCVFGETTTVDTRKLHQNKYSAKKTYNSSSLSAAHQMLSERSFSVQENTGVQGQHFDEVGSYTYDVYLRATSLHDVAVDFASYTVGIEAANKRAVLTIPCSSGGFSLLVVRTAPSGNIATAEYYADPNELDDPTDAIQLAFIDYGSFAYFGTGGVNSPALPYPWISVDEKPVMTIKEKLFEANGALVTTDDSDCGIGKSGSMQVPTFAKVLQNQNTLRQLWDDVTEITTAITGAKWSVEPSFVIDADTGEIIGGRQYITENLIPIEPGAYAFYDEAGDFTTKFVGIYKADGTFIRRLHREGTADPLYFDIADFEDAAFIRLCASGTSDKTVTKAMKLDRVGVWCGYAWYGIDSATGDISTNAGKYNLVTLDMIRVEGGATYTHKNTGDEYLFTYKGILEYDAEKNFIKFTSGGDTTDSNIVTLQANTMYVRLSAYISTAIIAGAPDKANPYITNENLVGNDSEDETEEQTAFVQRVKDALPTLTVTGVDADGNTHAWTMYGVTV